MSFITKRERVFNEYDLFDLPARNEGKLKAYSSCTDARAWSHFCSDKTEHLVEIIKRNNEKVRPKYVPTEIIVNTLMISKNAEIARLKRKIEEFEQMIAAYDQLELTCDQKCEIANAHAAIKAANKELDDMCLDLDLSGYTEGIDSEAFETGKSRGDELKYTGETEKSRGDEWLPRKVSTPRMETKSNQFGESCTCDASTSAYDTRIDDLQETIISKDAKLNAMQNTIAVMENDVCEPYCVYAHIYTALEKIFGTLCQNEKYKEYLDLLTAGKDIRGIDITGKILFKIKVLEKFSLALIAPCSQEYSTSNDCSCYHAEIVTQLQTTFALTSGEVKFPSPDNKRAQLIADIMQNDEIKEILSKESLSSRNGDDQMDECYIIDNYNIDFENLKRLKNLQSDYDDLLNCYENLKHERDSLNIQCQKYIQLEQECECLQHKLREYNQLWKEKEFYRNRSEDLDTLKENYLLLADETSNVETKLRAEQEINKVKSKTVDELRTENIQLDHKLTEASLAFEKQKNILLCKLKEYECKIMCQEQQIKSLTMQIDNLLENDTDKIPTKDEPQSIELFDEIESQKEQIENLKNALCCNEEEKQYYREEFEHQLNVINQLKLEVEEWKSNYEKTLQKSKYLEKCIEDCHAQIDDYQESNKALSAEIETKISAIDNLNDILYNKSQEVSHLITEIDRRKEENECCVDQINSIQNKFNKNLQLLQDENNTAIASVQLAKEESLLMLESIKNRDLKINTSKQNIKNVESEILIEEIDIQCIVDPTNEKNQKDNSCLLKEIQLLRRINLENINILRGENEEFKKSLHLAQKQSEILNKKVLNRDDLIDKLQQLTKSQEILMLEKDTLQQDLHTKTNDVNKLLHDYELTNKKSEDLLDRLQKSENEYIKLHKAYQNIVEEKKELLKETSRVEALLNDLSSSQEIIKEQYNDIFLKATEIKDLKASLSELNNKCNFLQEQKQILEKKFDSKCDELKGLYANLETKIDENNILNNKCNLLKFRETEAKNNIEVLRKENSKVQANLDAFNKESSEKLNKLQYYENLENEYRNLCLSKKVTDAEKNKLQADLQKQIQDFKKLEEENKDLIQQNKTLQSSSKDLEKSLILAREQTLLQSDFDPLPVSYSNIKSELDNLKAEKISYNKKICKLQEKLDESEYYINNLNEGIIAREKKITTLENHINSLEDEIRKLQRNLDEVVESGEEIRKLSFEKIDQSRKMLEAHHAKTTHNMKMDLVKSQSEKAKLEAQLSQSTILSNESCKEKDSIINKLQQERGKIVSNIQQLEINIFKTSNLYPNESSVEEVIKTLDRVGKYLNYKNTSLEKTLLNVQDSYHILKSKAGEAKTILEKERQKIIDEKEEMQKQLEDLRNRLNQDKITYLNTIQDLQGEISNQSLIFDKVKQLNENEILKLNNEKIFLQDSLENSLIAQKDLQEKLNKEYNENILKQKMLEKVEFDLKNKNNEILNLQKVIGELKNKLTKDLATQTFTNYTEVATDTYEVERDSITNDNFSKNYNYDIEKNISNTTESLIQKNKATNLKLSELLINSGNMEPSIEILKYIYVNYKIKNLRTTMLEQYSITSLNCNISSDNNVQEFKNVNMSKNPHRKHKSLRKSNINSMPGNDSIVSIYNTKIYTDSTKNTYDTNNNISRTNIESLKSSPITDLGLSNEVLENNYKADKLSKDDFINDDSSAITDKDLFLIYEDGQTDSNRSQVDKNPWSANGLANIIVERASIHTNLKPQFNDKTKQQAFEEIKVNTQCADNGGEMSEDDSIKPKLKVKLPRIFTDTISPTTFSVDERSSTDSYMRAIYVSPKRMAYSDTNINSKNHELNNFDLSKMVNEWDNNNGNNKDSIIKQAYLKPLNKTQGAIQHIEGRKKHITGLKRMNADIHILTPQTKQENELGRYLNGKIHLNNVVNVSSDHNTYSDEKICSSNINALNTLEKSNSFNQLLTVYSPTSFNLQPKNKSAVERAILVKMDNSENYEEKILQLTKTLENIEKDYKNKIEAIKIQYDSNVKRIVNEHNQGVESIQSLHEERLYDIIKVHENEIENLRAMSIEALRKVERLENENRYLKSKLDKCNINLDEVPVKITTPELKRKKGACRAHDKMLTQTNVAVLAVKPKKKNHGPCTCSIDINVSDTVRNIFEQVDIEQRKMAEQAYLKYIANKILSENVEVLDAQELSFLHLEVCRTWKSRINKEESLQKLLECKLFNKQRQTHKQIAELDRKVAEEWQRLQEAREAVNPNINDHDITNPLIAPKNQDIKVGNSAIEEKLSASELELSCICKPRRVKASNRAVLVKMDAEGRKDKLHNNDEMPTRLKRTHEHRSHKK